MDTMLITRMILSVIAIANIAAQTFGWNPLATPEENDVYMVVSLIAMIVVWARGFWKNNNFTEAARASQLVLDEIKKQQIENPQTSLEISVKIPDEPKEPEGTDNIN